MTDMHSIASRVAMLTPHEQLFAICKSRADLSMLLDATVDAYSQVTLRPTKQSRVALRNTKRALWMRCMDTVTREDLVAAMVEP